MASNDGYVSDRNVTQQRIEIEEKVQNDDSLTEVKLLLIKIIFISICRLIA